MFFPFVSRARFDDMLREKNTQIGDRDHRIAELEAERRILVERIFSAAFPQGEQVEGRLSESACEPEAPASLPRRPGNDTQTPVEEAQPPRGSRAPILHRPSQIMRRMDRLAQERWLRKLHPAKAAEEERDRVMAELNAAHAEAVRNAGKNF